MSQTTKPAAAPAANAPAMRAGGPAGPVGMPARPAGLPGTDRRTLVVGRGISVTGTLADCERVVVEGTVESQLLEAMELAIGQGGVFRGEVQVEDAEISGLFDGTLTVRGSLVIRASGRVNGIARCRRLTVEDGGQLMGRMEMLSDTPAAAAPAVAPAAASAPIAMPPRPAQVG